MALLLIRPALGVTGDLAAAIAAAGTAIGAILSMSALWLFARHTGRTIDLSELKHQPLTTRAFAFRAALLVSLAVLGLFAMSQIPMLFKQ